jgi:hypothetical protein
MGPLPSSDWGLMAGGSGVLMAPGNQVNVKERDR